MANDSNRYALPVKEESSGRFGKSVSEKIDRSILAKLQRCDLEDKVLRLLEEQSHLKKVVNYQEEKLKRLGVKLLRLLGERKNGKKSSEQIEDGDEMNLRIIELERENYTLKDKNTVLKQQLASHSRHVTIHSSLARSNQTSPLVSGRQAGPPLQTEPPYDVPPKNKSNESQSLKEAEAHIKELNSEIKNLNSKLEDLHQDIEKNSFDSRKTKVTENIELIRLQRCLKHQSIQIAALQAQIKNSENVQNTLKEELVKAHIDNDEALQLISVKQNEILNLCSKLDDKNLNRLEEDELKERIKDLMVERDALRERSERLMETIRVNEGVRSVSVNSSKVSQEKCIQCDLIVGNGNTLLKKGSGDVSQTSTSEGNIRIENVSTTVFVKKMERKKERTSDSEEVPEDEGEKSDNFASFSYNRSRRKSSKGIPDPDLTVVNSEPLKSDEVNRNVEMSEEKHLAEKMKLEREIEFLRGMLKNQTCRCETQQAEINRLMHELRISDDKCKETLQRLDHRLDAFSYLESQKKTKNEETSLEKVSSYTQTSLDLDEMIKRASSGTKNTPVANKYTQTLLIEGQRADYSQFSLRKKNGNSSVDLNEKPECRSPSDLEKSIGVNSLSLSEKSENEVKKESSRKECLETNPESCERGSSSFAGFDKLDCNKRFVDHVFLESSDEDLARNEFSDKNSYFAKINELQYNEAPLASSSQEYQQKGVSDKYKRRFSSGFGRLRETFKYVDTIVITILWLQLEEDSSLWADKSVKFLFADFSFLDVHGEETETLSSLPKPKNSGEKCRFGFSKIIQITESRKEALLSLLTKYDSDIIIFKVVSDPEESEHDRDSEDVGVAVVTVKQFLKSTGHGFFHIPVKNIKDTNEVVGKLAVSIGATFDYDT